jgi:hypothetical protein
LSWYKNFCKWFNKRVHEERQAPWSTKCQITWSCFVEFHTRYDDPAVSPAGDAEEMVEVEDEGVQYLYNRHSNGPSLLVSQVHVPLKVYIQELEDKIEFLFNMHKVQEAEVIVTCQW